MDTRRRHTPGLTAALWRARLGNRGLWGAAAVLGMVLAILLVFSIRIPARVEYLLARVDSVGQHESDSGTRPVLAATTEDGRVFPVVGSSRMTAIPSPGDRICLRVQTDRFTGRVTARRAAENPDCRPMPQS